MIPAGWVVMNDEESATLAEGIDVVAATVNGQSLTSCELIVRCQADQERVLLVNTAAPVRTGLTFDEFAKMLEAAGKELRGTVTQEEDTRASVKWITVDRDAKCVLSLTVVTAQGESHAYLSGTHFGAKETLYVTVRCPLRSFEADYETLAGMVKGVAFDSKQAYPFQRDFGTFETLLGTAIFLIVVGAFVAKLLRKKPPADAGGNDDRWLSGEDRWLSADLAGTSQPTTTNNGSGEARRRIEKKRREAALLRRKTGVN